jgi:hypothetical protein
MHIVCQIPGITYAEMMGELSLVQPVKDTNKFLKAFQVFEISINPFEESPSERN